MFKKKNFYNFWPIVVIFILVTIFFGKTLIPPSGSIIYGGDLNDQFYFWKSFYVDNIKNGVIPFWNPYSFSGTPFLAHPATVAFYPLNFIFFIFPVNVAFSVFLYIHVVLAGLFMYLLCRKYTEKIPALSAAIVFCLSGLMAARIYAGHIDIISTFIWIPAVFWSVTNALENGKRKYISLSILFLTLQILAGYMVVVVFTLELIFIYKLVITILGHYEPKMTNGIKSFLTLFFIIIMSFGISAIQILPAIEFVRNSIRGQGLPYDLLTWGSYTKDLFLTFLSPFKYGNPFPENYTYNGPGPNFFELSYFTGIIPILLFISYIVYKLYNLIRFKKTDKVFLGLLSGLIFFVLVSLGNNFPLHFLLYKLIPFYRLFRIPPQHLIVVVFIIALISSFSLTLIKNKIIQVAIVFLIIIELFNYDKKFIRLTAIPTKKFDINLVETLKSDKELYRVLPDYSVVSGVRHSWDFESSMYYKINSTSGYNPILLNNYYHFIDLLNNNYTSSINKYNVEIPPPDPTSKDIDFLNIKYILADKNYDQIKEKNLSKYSLKKEGETYRLYENKDYLPRFFIDCLGKGIQKGDILDYQLNRIRLRINSVCEGILTSSEVYYPGWKASVDGRVVQISRSNTAFRSIFLPKGEHTVEFYYQPTIYYLGGVISLVSLIMALIVIAIRQPAEWRSRLTGLLRLRQLANPRNDNIGIPRGIPKW